MPANKKSSHAPKKGLGRGFDSLIPTDLLDESFDPTAAQDDKVSDLRTIKLSEIHADSDQPRKQFDEPSLDELAASIREHGIIQPLVVTPRRAGGYTIVAGERRYRAADRAGLDRVPVLVRTLGAQHKLELSIIENVQRRDLSPIETATAYAKLRDQFNLSLEEIGQRVGGKSVSAINNTIRLLRLPKVAKEALMRGDLNEGQARPLVGMDEEKATRLVEQILAGSMSARQIENLVAESKATKKKPASQPPHPAAIRLETVLRMPVRMTENRRSGKGSLTIQFGSAEQRDALLERLGKK